MERGRIEKEQRITDVLRQGKQKRQGQSHKKARSDFLIR